MSADRQQIADWEQRLRRLHLEMELASSPVPADTNPPDYESLVRIAWREARRALKQCDEKGLFA